MDSAHDTRLGADNKDAQDFLNTLGQGQTYVDKLTGQTFQLFAADEATRNNHAMFGQYTKTPAVENLLDRAYAAVTLPKDAQTIQGLNGSFKGSLTGSDLALNDAARDTSNMWKQPPVVQWAVLGHLRQERSENMQGQIDLMDELRKLNASGDLSLEARNRKLQIINDLTNLEHENQVMLKASQLHILGMGQNGLLSPINQRETFEGFGSARSSGGLNFRGMSSASINARIGELKFAKAAAATEAKAIEQARIDNNLRKDVGVDPYAVREPIYSSYNNSQGTANSATAPKLSNDLRQAELNAIAIQDPRLAAAVRGGGDNATTNYQGVTNFGVGSGNFAEAERLGRIWVGDGASPVANQAYCPGCLISADGTRLYRPPSYKPNAPAQFNPSGVQANFVTRNPNTGATITNGHLVVRP